MVAMTVVESRDGTMTARATDGGPAAPVRPPIDRQRTYRLILATVWLLDAVLQIQPFMFSRGPDGFSGMLNGTAAGNPSWIAHAITWNASLVYHQPILTNSAFAGIQFLIAFGIIYRRTCKPALVLSIVWSLGVWWFGEGLGAIFSGGDTTLGGGPGGVLFYALLAVLLWPSPGSDRPFVAARTVGVKAAKAIWAVMWALLALFSVVGSGRSPQALHDLVADLNVGQPGWLMRINRSSEALFLHHGTTVAILLAAVCLVIAAGVFLPPQFTQLTVVVAVVVFAVIGVAVQDVGGILAGGMTDPNSAPLVILIALIYWPLTVSRADATDPRPDLAVEAGAV
jgi:hypothetical protein